MNDQQTAPNTQLTKTMDYVMFNRLLLSLFFVITLSNCAFAGAIFNTSGNTLIGGARWDANERIIAGVGERSLAGGIRYSVQGGSFESFRDAFSWSSLPSIADFANGVQSAFDIWSSVDPVSGLGSDLYFVPDLTTEVVGKNTNGNGGLDIAGAEIDLFATNDAYFWNVGSSGTQAETWFNWTNDEVALTSGTENYTDSSAITGADILINSNTNARYNLDVFVRLLAHEIGHAIGLADVDVWSERFIDDNYDPADPQATLTNSWANRVDVYDPSSSPLNVYDVGTDPRYVAGVDILMESYGLGIAPGNPVGNPNPLTNDDYGTRQFLYPFIAAEIPEPASFALVLSALFLLVRARKASI